MPCRQFCTANPIVPPVLGTIRQKGTVRPDRGSDQRALHRLHLPLEMRHRIQGQLHAQLPEPEYLLGLQPAPLKPFQTGLIAGGDQHVGAGAQIVEMHSGDLLGVVDQPPRRPERIAQVRPASLQLGCQPTVQDQHPAAGQSIPQQIFQFTPHVLL